MGKKRTTGAHKPTTDENNGSGGLVPGSTLEDYFHSKQFAARSDASVSKHLLVGSPMNNAMAVERVQDGDEVEAGESKAGADDPELTAPPRSRPDDADDAKVSDSKHSDGDDTKECDVDDDVDVTERGDAVVGVHADDAKALSNHDEYEDDYESESSNPDASVAGMTLSDYLHAKEAKNVEDDVPDDDAAAGPKQTAKKLPHESVGHAAAAAAPKKLGHAVVAAGVAKKASASLTLVSGMSLDHYLGTSASDETGGELNDSSADCKSPTWKRKKSKHKASAKSLLSKPVAAGGSGGAIGSSTGTLALAQDDHATPFMKRQTKKLRAKLRQQPTGSVSKAILLADSSVTTISSTHSLLLQPRALKDKKKLSPPTHPLPKLIASSSAARVSVHDAGDESDSSGGSEKKLPPLGHH